MVVCELGKAATTPSESSAIIADANYLINLLVQEKDGRGGGMKCVDFQEELLATKPNNVQKFLHVYLNPSGTSAKNDTFSFRYFRKLPTDASGKP